MCSPRGQPCLANCVWRHSPASIPRHHRLDIDLLKRPFVSLQFAALQYFGGVQNVLSGNYCKCRNYRGLAKGGWQNGVSLICNGANRNKSGYSRKEGARIGTNRKKRGKSEQFGVTLFCQPQIGGSENYCPSGHLCKFIARFAEIDSPQEPSM